MGLRILVATADDAARDAAVAALTGGGFEALAAATEADALKILEGGTAVALVDEAFPGALPRAIHQTSPHTRCVSLLASPSVSSLTTAMRAGAFDYLEKPIDAEALLATIERAAFEHRARARQEKQQRAYEALFETVPGVVFFMTEEGVFQRVNAEGARLLGYEPADLVGLSYRSLLPKDDTGADLWAFRERRTGKRATLRRRVELLARTGERHTFEVCSTGIRPAAGSQGPSETLGVGWDITETLALQDQLRHAQKMDAVGRIAGGVAHDFNNLLQVITANARLLRGELPGTGEASELVEDVLTAAKRGANITRQLLMFSRKQRQELRVIDLRDVVSDMRSMLERLCEGKPVVRCELPPEPMNVRADRGHLEQVFMNLTINARDACANDLVISLQEKTSEGRRIVVASVTDTGSGMDEDVKRHLFEPFFTTKGPEKGTGLGLAVVYGIVVQHGGAIHVDSEVGVGTNITLTLPWSDGVAEKPEQSAKTVTARGGELILLVEDEELVRRVFKRTLERSGYRVVEAGDGTEALQLYARTPDAFALVVTDLRMPGRNGAELSRQLRALSPRMPILYLSGHPESDGGALLTERAELLEKPLSATDLLEKVRSLIDAH